MAKWKHLASAPCRHQRLPASILKPPRLPLAEDTSACGKAEGSGAYRTGGRGGRVPAPPSTAWETPRQCRETDNTVFNTGLYWR